LIWICRLKTKKDLKEEIKFNDELIDNAETTYDGKLNFNEIISKLSKERATNYNDWFYIGVALINLSYRKIIKRGQIYDLFDLFSSKADNYDADSVNKVIDTNINRFDGKGCGIKYLLDCREITIFFQTFFQSLWIVSKSLEKFGKVGKKFGKTFPNFVCSELLF